MTAIVQIDINKIGRAVFENPDRGFLSAWHLDTSQDASDFAKIEGAASVLRESDGLIAFPTETVYGLGANVFRASAVAAIFKAKRRPIDNPLIVHISSLDQLRRLLGPNCGERATGTVDPIPQIYRPLIDKFWPGPLTIICVLPNDSQVAKEATASLSTIGIRMPASLLSLALIHTAGIPIAAPSANASSKPSATTAQHVFEDLQGYTDQILDAGPCAIGIESTIVDGLSHPPRILRPGRISLEALRSCQGWGDAQYSCPNSSEMISPRAPGMKYKHYSPSAQLFLMKSRIDKNLVKTALRSHPSLGILWTSTPTPDLVKNLDFETIKPQPFMSYDGYAKTALPTNAFITDLRIRRIALSPSSIDESSILHVFIGPSHEDISFRLFSAFRAFDKNGVKAVLVDVLPLLGHESSIAILNRLRKAASDEIGGKAFDHASDLP